MVPLSRAEKKTTDKAGKASQGRPLEEPHAGMVVLPPEDGGNPWLDLM